jgi:N-acetylglucosaminyldiphosphoundecaprenol N-acetyl-beta-D-mannosaminyltransferase
MIDLINILGVPIKKVKKTQFLELITQTIEQNKQLQIATVNAEFLVKANKNQNFKEILKTTFNVADTVTILWAGFFIAKMRNLKGFWGKVLIILFYLPSLFCIFFNRICFHEIPERLSGADIFWDLARLANQKKWRVFLLGASSGVAQKAKQEMQKYFPNLNIMALMGDNLSEIDLKEKIKSFAPKILFVAYGAPKQEQWLKDNLQDLNKSLVGIGVGGTLNFVAGDIKRAPSFMRIIGLEWFYRLILEPKKRAKRIINAVFVFPYLVLKNVLKNS